jgi:hypothetical protein
MRKRKPPIVPVTLLVVLFGVVGYTNYKSSPVNLKPPTPPVQAAEAKETPARSVISDKLKASIVPDKTEGKVHGGAGPLSPPSPMDSMPEEVRKMALKGMKKAPKDPSLEPPKPNESATSTQWYTDEAKRPGS